MCKIEETTSAAKEKISAIPTERKTSVITRKNLSVVEERTSVSSIYNRV